MHARAREGDDDGDKDDDDVNMCICVYVHTREYTFELFSIKLITIITNLNSYLIF